jgi:hypothetical protein
MHSTRRGGESELHVGVAATLANVAGGAIDVEVGPDASFEGNPRIIGVDKLRTSGLALGEFSLEESDVFERA